MRVKPTDPQSSADRAHSGQGLSEDEISLLELWEILRSGKWRILAVTCVFSLASLVYAVSATEWFRAEVLLAPATERNISSLQNQLGGIAALAGVNIDSGDSVEAVATLTSREFSRGFIEDNGLLTVLLAEDWDADNQRWIEQDPAKQPDLRDAVRYFRDDVLRVDEDRATGLVTVAIEWTEPVLAAQWASSIVDRLNAKMRERALQEAESNVFYLREELEQTNVVTLQQAVGRLLESELQKLMLARGTKEFAFRVIDSAEAPKRRVRPKRALIVAVGTVAGAFVGLMWVLLGHALRR